MREEGRRQLHISAIPQSHMGATRDHETRRLAERRSATGMPRRRFDLKVAIDLHSPFPVPLHATFVKRRRAIPTFGSRQAPRHESDCARHKYTRILALRKQLSYHHMFRRGRMDIHSSIIAPWLPIFVQPRRGVFVSDEVRIRVLRLPQTEGRSDETTHGEGLGEKNIPWLAKE